jgi:hypothetical protein
MIAELDIAGLSASQPAEGDDRALLKRLARACRGGTVAIEADPRHLAHIHSPVLSQADGNQWLYSLVAVGAALWWALDWRWAAGAALAWLAAYLAVGRRRLARRLMLRIERRLDDPAAWNALWSFGGIALADRESGRRCAAPEEDWRGFARSVRQEQETRP